MATPQRLLDSRPGATTADGQFAGIGLRAAGSTLTLHVAGRTGVPVDANAVVVNVTAVDPTGVGFLTVFPCGAAEPNASNVNYGPGTNVANAVFAKLGTNGDVCIYTYAATHLIVDAAGYLPAGSYVPLAAPQRLLDTRAGTTTADGQFAGIGQQAAGSTLTLHVAGRVGLAASVGAVVLNVTAIDPAGTGFLTVFPCGAAQPNASNLNFYAGTNVANTVIARTGTNGDICTYASAATQLVIDVAGSLPATTYTPLGAPQRLLDSRPGAATADAQFAGVGQQAAGSSLQLPVAGRVGVPADAGAVVLNVTAVDPTDVGFLTVSPTGAAQPNASNLNYQAGHNIANTVIAKLGKSGQLCVFTSAATHLVVDVAGYLPGPAPTSGGPDCPQPPPPPACPSGGANPGACVWPGAGNTGYRHAPNCNGLTTFSGTIQSNTTYNCMYFPGGVFVGSATSPVSHVAFYGCLFKGVDVGGALVALFGDDISFDYSSFEPGVAAPPVSYSQSYQYGIAADGSYSSHVGRLTVSHSDFWGFGNAIDVDGSTQAKPQSFTDNYIHDAADDGGGSYHTDGIGTISGSGGGSYVVIDHNTIVSRGSTNGLAFQQGVYDHFTVTNNLFSGFGFTVAIWAPATYTTFTDNTYSTVLRPELGPLYSTAFANSTGSTWRRNRWLVPSDAEWGNPNHNGWFWIPTGASIKGADDTPFVSQTDYTG